MNTPQQKFCPILTAAVVKAPEEQKVVGLDGKKPEKQGFDAVPCAGTACAFFTPVVRAGGKQVDGHCAVYLFPTAISMLNDTIRNVTIEPAAVDPEQTN